MFGKLICWSLDRKLHFRSDYGDTIVLFTENKLLEETSRNILQRLKFGKDEFILNVLLKPWYVYYDQDQTCLEFFMISYLEYCFRFLKDNDKTFPLDTDRLNIQNHDPL
jgi:hypothetical protein